MELGNDSDLVNSTEIFTTKTTKGLMATFGSMLPIIFKTKLLQPMVEDTPAIIFRGGEKEITQDPSNCDHLIHGGSFATIILNW